MALSWSDHGCRKLFRVRRGQLSLTKNYFATHIQNGSVSKQECPHLDFSTCFATFFCGVPISRYTPAIG